MSDNPDLSQLSDDELAAERKRRADERRQQRQQKGRERRQQFLAKAKDKVKRKDKGDESTGRPRYGAVIALLAIIALLLGYNTFKPAPQTGISQSEVNQAVQQAVKQALKKQQSKPEQSGLTGDVTQKDLKTAKVTSVTKGNKKADKIDQLEQQVRNLKQKLADKKPEPIKTTTKQKRVVAKWLKSMGLSSDQFRFDHFTQDTVERGSSFSKKPIETRKQLVSFLNSNGARASAVRAVLRKNLTPKAYKRALNGEGFVPVQFTVPVEYIGNTYFRTSDDAAVYSLTPRRVAAGDKIWVYVNEGQVHTAGSVRVDCGNVRITHVRVVEKRVVQPIVHETIIKQQPPTHKPPKQTPPTHKPPKQTPPTHKPPKEHKKVEACNVLTGKTEKVPEGKQNEYPYAPKGAPECQPAPPCKQKCQPTPPPKKTCPPGQKGTPPNCHKVTPPPESCKENPNQDKCKTTPPPHMCPGGRVDENGKCLPPPHLPVKCSDNEGHQDGLCGTPNKGAEQQDPQKNDKGKTAPTKGYDDPDRSNTSKPGPAEKNDSQQDQAKQDVQSGKTDTHDPTKSGTEVDNSKEGGKAPGGAVTNPSDQPEQPQGGSQPTQDNPATHDNGNSTSGQDNPAYDGSQHSTNPDKGTSDPVDTPASQHDNSKSSTTKSSDNGSTGSNSGSTSDTGNASGGNTNGGSGGNTDGPHGTDSNGHDSGANSGDPLSGMDLPNTE